ncbi:cupin domain-containing protein [Rubrivivax sp. RP6-9]|uniref:cupin domain-containing protein n=1 Tax=Rubrivivax sp. RP6-9 TaxID=3415750 RepID=UPI003CC568C9
MHVTRFDAAPDYTAPNHVGMRCQRLQGREAGPAEQLWLGVSTIEPGGHTGLDGSPMEKHYVVLEGALVLIGELDGQRQEATLGRFDSCRFAPGEQRQLVNRSNAVARVLLAMPFQPPAPAAAP